MAFSLSSTFKFEIELPEGSLTAVYKTLSAADLLAHDTALAQFAEQFPTRKVMEFYIDFLPNVLLKINGLEIDEKPVDFAGMADKPAFISSLPILVVAKLIEGFRAQVTTSEDTKKKFTNTSNG